MEKLLYSMEANVSERLQFGTFINAQKIPRKPTSLQLFLKPSEQRLFRIPHSCTLLTTNTRHVLFRVSSCLQNVPGMMGSGKTTVGKVLSEAIGYSFRDCDKLIEQTAGGISVADIFKLYGENYFRDYETEVLQKLSLIHRLVVSTGGGAVVRPINWRHIQKGISVWLDVPLEALAQRTKAEGTGSRPLLEHESGDPYSKLRILFEQRGKAYANANARVSLENIALKLGLQDVYNISPTEIAIEVLVQIESFLKD